MAEYPNTPFLGLKRPIANTGQAWSTQKYIVDNMDLIEAFALSMDGRVDTAEAKLTALEIKAYARIVRTTAQSIASSGNPTGGAGVDVVFNTDELSEGFDYATTGLTCQVEGLYLFKSRLAFGANATGYRYTNVFVNGVSPASQLNCTVLNNGASHSTDVSATDFLPLAVGDVITLKVGQASGAALNLNAGAALELWRIGPKLFNRAT